MALVTHRTTGDATTSADLVRFDTEILHRIYAERPSRELEGELLRRYEGLAHQQANRFSHRGEATEDLRQVALLGLLAAIKGYDPKRGTRFSTYAVPTIVGELKRHFRDRTWLVKPPRQVQETYLVVQRAIADLDGHLGRRPTLTEVGDYAGLSISDVTEALQAAGGRWAVSLDAPLPQHDHATLGATLAEDDADLAAAENSTVVDHMLGLLPPVEREVVTLSFFDGLSQAEIAFVLGTNQGAVSRVRRRALARLGALSRDEPAVA